MGVADTLGLCLLTLIEPKRQTLPEINVHARLFGTLQYLICIYFAGIHGFCWMCHEPNSHLENESADKKVNI